MTRWIILGAAVLGKCLVDFVFILVVTRWVP